MSEVLVNPYRYAGSWIDDSGLKAYWKFNESSGNIINQSESSDTLGSSANLTMTGGTYEQTAPIGSANAVLFDGTDDFAVAGTSLSQFNFIHEGQSTFCYWLKLVSSVNYGVIFMNDNWTPNAGTKVITSRDAPCGTDCGTLNQTVMNGETLEANSVIVDHSFGQPPTNSGYIPDIIDFYFYVVKIDVDETTDTLIGTRNNANETKGNRINAPLVDDSPSPFTIARRSNASQYFANIELSEMSIWNRILTNDEIIGLYNSGSGRAIYE